MQRLSKEKLLPFPVVKGGNEREQDIAKEITKETIDLMKVILVLEIQPTLTLLRRDSTVDITRGILLYYYSHFIFLLSIIV